MQENEKLGTIRKSGFSRLASVGVVFVLGLALLGVLVTPPAAADHLYRTLRVSEGFATSENNPSILFGPDGQVIVAYSRLNTGTGARDIIVRADQDGWAADGQPVFTSVSVANDNAGTADWGFFDTVPMAYDAAAGSLYVAWVDTRNLGTTGPDIRVARSDNDGSSFGASVLATDFTGMNGEGYPRLAVGPSGTVYCVWIDNRDGTNEVFFSSSADQGLTWSANVKVNDNAGPHTYPRIAVDSQERIFVTWSDFSGANLLVQFDRSLDRGATWGTDVSIGTSTGGSWIADVTVGRNDIVHVAWQDDRLNDAGVYYSRSLDHGVSWTLDGRVNWLNQFGDPLPRIATSADGAVYVLWGAGGPPAEVSFAIYGEDGAIMFGLAGVTGGAQRYNVGVDGNGNLFAVWSQNVGGPVLEVFIAFFDADPAAVTGLTATEPAANTALMSWNPNTEIDLGHYLVYKSAPDGTFDLGATVPAGTNSATITGLADGRWVFVVIAVDRHGHASEARTVALDVGLSTDERLDQLETDLAALQGDVDTLQSQNNALQSDLDDANRSLGQLGTQLESTQTLLILLLVIVIVLSLVSLVLAMRGRKGASTPKSSWQPPPPPQ